MDKILGTLHNEVTQRALEYNNIVQLPFSGYRLYGRI